MFGKFHRPPCTAFHLGVVSLEETKCVQGSDIKVLLQIFDRHWGCDYPSQLHLRSEEMVCCFLQFLLRQRGDGMSSRMMRVDHHIQLRSKMNGLPLSLPIYPFGSSGDDSGVVLCRNLHHTCHPSESSLVRDACSEGSTADQ